MTPSPPPTAALDALIE